MTHHPTSFWKFVIGYAAIATAIALTATHADAEEIAYADSQYIPVRSCIHSGHEPGAGRRMFHASLPACTDSLGFVGLPKIHGEGRNRQCICVPKPPDHKVRTADVSLVLETRDALPGPATFNMKDGQDNQILIYLYGIQLYEYTTGIDGFGEVDVEVLDDRIRLTPRQVSFTSPAETFFQDVSDISTTELVEDSALTPIEFDRKTGALLNLSTVTLRTTNWLYTDEKPLYAEAIVGGHFDIALGRYHLNLFLWF